MNPALMMWSTPAEKENQPSAAAPKKGGGGGGAAATTAKKGKDPAKSVLRLPTPGTLRKAANADDETIANTDPKDAKKFGKDHVKNVHKPVDDDWHDGGEDQAEALYEYFKGFQRFVGGVFNLAVRNGTAFERCHEVMKALADSWENMKSIPARSGIEEEFEEDRKEMNGMDDLCVKVDIARESKLSSSIEDGLLYRWMKDASDYGASFSKSNKFFKLVAGETVAKDKAGAAAAEAAKSVTLRAEKSGMDLRGGLKRFLKLNGNTSQWARLQTCKVTHERKRVIDRRFAGPKSRRTRDFDCFW